MARGIHGQSIYVDPMAGMAIARYASHPVAANAGNGPITLPTFHALARHLIARPQPQPGPGRVRPSPPGQAGFCARNV